MRRNSANSSKPPLKPLFSIDLVHLGADALHFLQPDVVDLLGRQVGCGVGLRQVGVPLLAIGQIEVAGGSPARRIVLLLPELEELLVGRVDLLHDDPLRLRLDAGLILLGNVLGKAQEGEVKQALLRFLDNLRFDLVRDQPDGYLRRCHAPGQPLAHQFHHLVVDARHLAEAGKVVIVVLGVLEGGDLRQHRQLGLQATALVDRHQVVGEFVPLDRQLARLQVEIVIDLVLVGELRPVDLLELGQHLEVVVLLPLGSGEIIGTELVVPPVVPEERRHRWKRFEIPVPLLFEQRPELCPLFVALLGNGKYRDGEKYEYRGEKDSFAHSHTPLFSRFNGSVALSFC